MRSCSDVDDFRLLWKEPRKCSARTFGIKRPCRHVRRIQIVEEGPCNCRLADTSLVRSHDEKYGLHVLRVCSVVQTTAIHPLSLQLNTRRGAAAVTRFSLSEMVVVCRRLSTCNLTVEPHGNEAVQCWAPTTS